MKISVVKKYLGIFLCALMFQNIYSQTITDTTKIAKDSTKTLKTVEISQKLPVFEKKVDRLVFNLNQSVGAAGGDLIDAMQRVPGVSIDLSNKSISIAGKNKVAVMLNGRLLDMSGDELFNFLRTLRADDISKIEIITSPPAQYDAEGNSGLINIVTKNILKDNISGTVGVTSVVNTYLKPFVPLFASINLQKGKFSLSAGGSAYNGALKSTETTKYFYPGQTWDMTMDRKNMWQGGSGNVFADYKLTKKSSIGMQAIIGGNSCPSDDFSTTTVYNQNKTIDSTLYTKAYKEYRSFSQKYNLHYLLKLDTIGKTITIDADYYSHDYINDRPFHNYSENSKGENIASSESYQQSVVDVQRDIWTSKIDFELPTNWAKFSTGCKVSFISIYNDAAFLNRNEETLIYIEDPKQSDIFNYTENTQAIYGSVSKTFGKKWETQLGLRIENTQISGNSQTYSTTTDTKYLRYFPTCYITFKANDDNKIGLTYNQRIGRPSFDDMNPMRWYSNAYTYSTGNTSLQPSYSNNFEISHTYKSNLNSSLWLNITKDGFGYITITKEKEIITAPENFFTNYSTGITESYLWKITKWLESNNRADAYYIYTMSDLTIVEPTSNIFTGKFSTTNTFTMNKAKTIFSELGFEYQFPNIEDVSYYSSYYALNAGVKASFLNKNLQISANFTDILKTRYFNSYSYVSGQRQESTYYGDYRALRLSISYKLGNSKISAKTRETSNADETNR